MAVPLWSADNCDKMDTLDMDDLISSVVGPDNKMIVAADIDRSIKYKTYHTIKFTEHGQFGRSRKKNLI